MADPCFIYTAATPDVYTLSLHDALPISARPARRAAAPARPPTTTRAASAAAPGARPASRSEEHTSELQSRLHLVCRLLLEKKKAQKLRARAICASGR